MFFACDAAIKKETKKGKTEFDNQSARLHTRDQVIR